MRWMRPLIFVVVLALSAAGCGFASDDNGTEGVGLPSATASWQTGASSPIASEPSASQAATGEPTGSASSGPDNGGQEALLPVARDVVEILRSRDLAALAERIDPELGLRFSPYTHMNTETDLVFAADELPAFSDATKRVWGAADGTGDPIELTFREYFEKFVYNQDFLDAPEISVNAIKATGNSPFNGTEVYPGSSYVEFYFPGFDAQYDGMDWQHLVLVFVPAGEQWNLAAIVHGQWTI